MKLTLTCLGAPVSLGVFVSGAGIHVRVKRVVFVSITARVGSCQGEAQIVAAVKGVLELLVDSDLAKK